MYIEMKLQTVYAAAWDKKCMPSIRQVEEVGARSFRVLYEAYLKQFRATASDRIGLLIIRPL